MGNIGCGVALGSTVAAIVGLDLQQSSILGIIAKVTAFLPGGVTNFEGFPFARSHYPRRGSGAGADLATHRIPQGPVVPPAKLLPLSRPLSGHTFVGV